MKQTIRISFRSAAMAWRVALLLAVFGFADLLRASTVPVFPAANAGIYTGIFSPTNDVDTGNSGLVTVTVGRGGSCSGKIYVRGFAYAIWPKKFDASGNVKTLAVLGSGELANVTLQLDATSGNKIVGSIAASSWTAPLSCNRTAFDAQHTTTLAGRYTLMLSNDSSAGPLGDGFAAVTVAANGRVSVNGAMSDAMAVAQNPTVTLSADGVWPFCAAAQRIDGRGLTYTEEVLGALQFGNGGVISGQVFWICDDPTNTFCIPLQASGSSYGVANPPPNWPAKENVHIYLLMGQSNMAGRATKTAYDKIPDLRVITFGDDNFWQPAVEPLEKNHGVGPGLAFGKVMANADSNVVVALVPTAVDSTYLSQWMPGAALYDNAVARVKLAMQWGTLKGFLWHQGENDSRNFASASTYETRLAELIGNIRTDLGATNAPFVVGEIGRYLYGQPNFPFATVVNKQLDLIPSTVPLSGCVDSLGLTPIFDKIHFDAASQREMGRRDAVMMLSLQAQAAGIP